jgi:hypothetical protein
MSFLWCRHPGVVVFPSVFGRTSRIVDMPARPVVVLAMVLGDLSITFLVFSGPSVFGPPCGPLFGLVLSSSFAGACEDGVVFVNLSLESAQGLLLASYLPGEVLLGLAFSAPGLLES